MKIAALSITGALLATVSWLVAGHAVGSTTRLSQAEPRTNAIANVHRDDDDEDDFFGGGAPLSNGVFEQPVMHSSGS